MGQPRMDDHFPHGILRGYFAGMGRAESRERARASDGHADCGLEANGKLEELLIRKENEMDYLNKSSRVAASSSPITTGIGGKQITRDGAIDSAKRALDATIELQSRLARATEAVIGPRPENVGESSPKLTSLAEILDCLHSSLQMCHEEINNLYTGLGV